MRITFRPIAVLILILAVVLLEAWALGRIPTRVPLVKFLDAISPAVTAVATAFIALFTATIFCINRSQLAHGRRVDRAYVNGGWGPHIDGKLYANINNDGKTPATVHHMVLAILPLAGLPSTPPALPRTFVNYNLEPYKRDFFSDHVFVEWDGLYEPERVLYGRFWYTDVFEKEHESGFLLHIRPRMPAVRASSLLLQWSPVQRRKRQCFELFCEPRGEAGGPFFKAGGEAGGPPRSAAPMQFLTFLTLAPGSKRNVT
jgi:hypothetical protein